MGKGDKGSKDKSNKSSKDQRDGEESSEDYEFIPPDFDEDAFIHKEMVSFKTTVTLIGSGIIAALLSWGIYSAMGGAKTAWFVSLLVAVGVFAALKPLFSILKFDISHYGRREWIGSAFQLFFTWLAFFMIFINPPISDFAEPQVDIFTPQVAQAGEEMSIDVFVADNHKLDGFSFEITQDDNVVGDKSGLEKTAGDHWLWTGMLPEGAYTVTVTADDKAGLSRTAHKNFTVTMNPLQVVVGDLRDPTGTLFVRVPSHFDTYSVYADIEGAGRVYLDWDESLGGWKATSNFKGWQADQTNNFTIKAEGVHRFHNQVLVRGAVLESGPHSVEVGTVGEFSKSIKKAQKTDAPAVDVPGFGTIAALGALVGIAVIVRRRQ